MSSIVATTGLSLTDIGALFFFLVAWMLHFWLVNYSPWHKNTISFKMNTFRLQWMRNMMYREPRMPDALIQNSLQYGVLFFASTSILLIGGLVTGLGAAEEAVSVMSDIPFVAPTTKTAWEVKVLLLILIFTFAFFKFAWSYRLLSYVLIVMGAAPDANVLRARRLLSDQGDIDAAHKAELTAELEGFAEHTAKLHMLGARHFTMGMNSYFFAIAVVVWFIDPVLFVVATLWVFMVLYRRAFRSNFMKALTILERSDSYRA